MGFLPSIRAVSVEVVSSRLSPRSRAARSAVRLVNTLSRRLGRGEGSVVGGWVGLAIDPQLVRALSRGREMILVSGTNGKTTTAEMLRRAWGDDTGGNRTGSNMTQGHVAALVNDPSPRMVLEVDEGYLGEIVAQAQPRAVVLLNLSRDQLDRAAEVRHLALKWREALRDVRGVVANANDPLVVYAAETARDVVWVRVPVEWRKDAASCPHCTRPLSYGPSGDWGCECGFARPATFVGELIDGSLRLGELTVPLELKVPGEVNRVNAVMALSALHTLGVDPENAARRLRDLDSVAGRYQTYPWRGRSIRLILAKNPAGFGEALRALEPGDEVWMAINSQIADGRDPSWLYDTDVSALAGRVVHCAGERRLDLATRLTYEGVEVRVMDQPSSTTMGEGRVSLVANYTAFREWRQMLERP